MSPTISKFFKKLLDKLTSLWYNRGTQQRNNINTITKEITMFSTTQSRARFTPSSKNLTTNAFGFDKTQAKIHGLSIQVGELFADLYRMGSTQQEEAYEVLEAYKSLRRALPTVLTAGGETRHVGHRAAYFATEGM